MATITINIPNAVIPRLKSALDEALSTVLLEEAVDPANPTNAEYLAVLQDYVVRDLKQLVRTAERNIARRQAAADTPDIEIT